jgi:hypothetical protein
VFDSEKLLRVDKSSYGPWHYKVGFVVSPPTSHTGKVALGIQYGEGLAWTFRSTRDWSCRWNPRAGSIRCTSKVSRPIPLRVILHVLDPRLQADASLVATASTGQVTDTDAFADIRVKRTAGRQPLTARLTETLQPLRRRRTR